MCRILPSWSQCLCRQADVLITQRLQDPPEGEGEPSGEAGSGEGAGEKPAEAGDAVVVPDDKEKPK